MALKKKATKKTDKTREVTFTLPVEAARNAKEVRIVGEFNNWNTTDKKSVMTRNTDGSFAITLPLAKGREYQFRYLIDKTRWENDWEADKYVPVPDIGQENSVVVV